MTDMTPTQTPATFTLRLTPEDRARLERDAGGMSLGAYIRWRVFDPAKPPTRRRGRFPVKDQQALSRALAALGQSRIASNLNQLAAAAHVGALPVTPDIEGDLAEAVRHVAEMRKMLIAALNLTDDAAGAP